LDAELKKAGLETDREKTTKMVSLQAKELVKFKILSLMVRVTEYRLKKQQICQRAIEAQKHKGDPLMRVKSGRSKFKTWERLTFQALAISTHLHTACCLTGLVKIPYISVVNPCRAAGSSVLSFCFLFFWGGGQSKVAALPQTLHSLT